MYHLNVKRIFSIILLLMSTIVSLQASGFIMTTNLYAESNCVKGKPDRDNKLMAKVQKKLNSKLGQWLLKRLKKKIAKRQKHLNKRITKGKHIRQKSKLALTGLGMGMMLGSILLGAIAILWSGGGFGVYILLAFLLITFFIGAIFLFLG